MINKLNKNKPQKNMENSMPLCTIKNFMFKGHLLKKSWKH